jgi:hypothetical protein
MLPPLEVTILLEIEWELADRPEVIGAFAGDERLLFLVLGQKPTPCVEVRVILGPEDVWPPIYHLEWREVGQGCPDVVTGYCLLACVSQRSSEHVVVNDNSGEQRVVVQQLREGILRGACEQMDVNT